MSKFKIILLLCLASFGVAIAQDANTKVSFASFNKELLKQLVFDNMNIVRDTLHARPLERDSLLSLAALNHVNYLVKTGQSTHKQDSKKTSTVEDRIIFFKGNYSTSGENNGYTYVGKSVLLKKENKKVIYETYGEAAGGLIKDMLNSSSQVKNMKNNEFCNVGLAVEVDESSKKIYLVAVLANKPYYHPAGVIQPTNAFGLLPYSEGPCLECRGQLKKIPNAIKYEVRVENNEVLFYFSDLAYFLKMSEKSFDGLSVDIIRRIQYPCETPNILNNSFAHKGVMLKPIKKKAILKGNRLIAENQVLVKLGDLPPNMANAELEFNLMFIKGKNLCSYVPQIGKYTDSLQLLPMGLYIDTLNPNAQLLLMSKEKVAMPITLDYQPEETSFNEEDLKVLFDYMNLSAHEVKALKVLVLTEVGSDPAKETERAKTLASSLHHSFQSLQSDTIKIEIENRENWTTLYEDLSKSSAKDLLDESRSTILSSLPKLLSADSVALLKSHQRKIFVFIQPHIKSDKNPQTLEQMMAAAKKAIDDEFQKGLLSAQRSLFNAVYFKRISLEDLKSLQIPDKITFAEAIANQAAFEFAMDSSNLKASYDKIAHSNDLVKANAKVLYNKAALHILLAQQDESIDIADLMEEVNALASYGIDKRAMNHLMANVYFLKAEKAVKNKQVKPRKEAIKSVVALYKDTELSEQEYISIASALLRFSEPDAAIELLKQYVSQEYVASSVLLKYLQIGLNDKEFKTYIDLKLWLENAFALNPTETCKLFTSKGLSYQLLGNEVIKNFYCESCK